MIANKNVNTIAINRQIDGKNAIKIPPPASGSRNLA
jgi:hypothetical protein